MQKPRNSWASEPFYSQLQVCRKLAILESEKVEINRQYGADETPAHISIALKQSNYQVCSYFRDTLTYVTKQRGGRPCRLSEWTKEASIAQCKALKDQFENWTLRRWLVCVIWLFRHRWKIKRTFLLRAKA